MRFIHAADIHLDSPLKGLEKYEGAPVEEIRGATRQAFENLVELTLERQADFLLIAGDLYDGNWRDHNTGLFFVAQMARLREAEIPVVVIRGNHDAENRMTSSLRLPDNVSMLSTRKAETCKLPKLAEMDVAVHGRSFAQAAETDDLAAQYPAARKGRFNIGLLHTSLDGRPGHGNYAPTSLDVLLGKGYDYWALGHIHQREELHRDPYIAFSGNTQGRHIRETGAKGCLVVDVDGSGNVFTQFEPLDVLRWSECRLDAEQAEDGEALLGLFSGELDRLLARAEDRLLAVRIVVEGVSHAHQQLVGDANRWVNELRGVALDRAAGRVWIEKVRLCTRPRQDLAELLQGDGPIGEMIDYVRQLEDDDEALAALTSFREELRRKLPDEVFDASDESGSEGLRIDDPDWWTQLAREIEPLLTARLQTEEARP
jgi:DNA repair exonuclease SbcCD nuclease subunit